MFLENEECSSVCLTFGITYASFYLIIVVSFHIPTSQRFDSTICGSKRHNRTAMKADDCTMDMEDADYHGTKYSHGKRGVCSRYFSFCQVSPAIFRTNALDHGCNPRVVLVLHSGDGGE